LLQPDDESAVRRGVTLAVAAVLSAARLSIRKEKITMGTS